ncbi:MAG: hypothetical protein HGB29_04770 [Chlorobiaceae bacterium]|nr:hypothetical protein [Chlorobiaceae bacterium]NTW74159.1 hypothetical protein [Chlorobiaceae bacterium]
MYPLRQRNFKIVTLPGWLALGFAWSIVALQEPLFTENQNTKFLHAAARTGQGFLGRDWMANTIDPLPAFTMLIETLFRLDSIWLVYLLFPVLLALLLFSLTSIADRLYGIRRNAAAMALFLGVLFIEQKNLQLGFGTQYLIGHYFQPCVFGVLIVLAIDRILDEARLQASALLAVAAAFHPAYMPSALLILGTVTAITIWKEKKVTAGAVLPLALFIALSAPLVLRYKLMFAYSSPSVGAEAMSILSTQRISVHTKVRSWLNYEDYANMALILVSMVMVRRTLLFWIMAPLAALIAVTVPLLYVFSWPSLEVLTPWRTSVILLPLSWTILAGWLASRLIPFMEHNRTVRNLLFALGCVAIAIPVALHLPDQISLFRNREKSPESPVMSFARNHSTASDLWLVPTREGSFDAFRLESGVPILANWKTHPYKDREILEWYRRNNDAAAFYDRAATPEGPELLRQLGKRYGVTHAVVGSDIPTARYSGMRICWKNERYTIIGLHDD